MCCCLPCIGVLCFSFQDNVTDSSLHDRYKRTYNARPTPTRSGSPTHDLVDYYRNATSCAGSGSQDERADRRAAMEQRQRLDLAAGDRALYVERQTVERLCQDCELDAYYDVHGSNGSHRRAVATVTVEAEDAGRESSATRQRALAAATSAAQSAAQQYFQRTKLTSRSGRPPSSEISGVVRVTPRDVTVEMDRSRKPMRQRVRRGSKPNRTGWQREEW